MRVWLPERTNQSDWLPVPCICALSPVPYMAGLHSGKHSVRPFSWLAQHRLRCGRALSSDMELATNPDPTCDLSQKDLY